MKWIMITIIIIIAHNFCIAPFSDVHTLTAFNNTLQHFLSENKISKGNNVHESNTYICIYIRTNHAYIYIYTHTHIYIHTIYKVHVPYDTDAKIALSQVL